MSIEMNDTLRTKEALEKLGDSHNFGRVVRSVGSQSILKPRPTLWEFGFLDGRSCLRQLLRELDICPAEWAPLAIEETRDFNSDARVERVSLEPLGKLSDLELESLGRQAGRLMALSLWFGITDLHADNILLGRKHGIPVLIPVDIECIWNAPVLLSNTLLLVPNNVSQTHCGLYNLLKLNSDLVATSALWNFRQALNQLEAKAETVHQSFSKLVGEGPAYSRVVLRPTRDYQASRTDSTPVRNFPYCGAEREQMDRGDIPYFFRDIRSQTVHYFSDHMRRSDLNSLYLDQASQCHRFLTFTAARVRAIPRKLIECGLLQIANNFLAKTRSSMCLTYRDLKLNKEGSRFSITLTGLAVEGFFDKS
jgi:hypothetical protein